MSSSDGVETAIDWGLVWRARGASHSTLRICMATMYVNDVILSNWIESAYCTLHFKSYFDSISHQDLVLLIWTGGSWGVVVGARR